MSLLGVCLLACEGVLITKVKVLGVCLLTSPSVFGSTGRLQDDLSRHVKVQTGAAPALVEKNLLIVFGSALCVQKRQI